MKDREKIEKLLKNYRSIRSNIAIELNKKYPEYSLDSIFFVKAGSGGNKVRSEVEDYVMDKYALDEETVRKIQVSQIIRAAYNSLPQEQKKIIADLYFEGKELINVAEGSDWSRWSVSRKRDKAIEQMKKVGILEAWEIWQKIPNVAK